MWLPKDERNLLAFYYSKLGDKYQEWLDLDKPTLIELMKQLKTLPKEGVNLDNELEIMNKPYFQKINAAHGHLIKRGLIVLGNSPTGYTRDSVGGVIYKMKNVCLKTEGCDLARKYSNWFDRWGLWWEDHKINPIWIILGFIISFLAGLLPNYMINSNVPYSKAEKDTKQEIRTLFESVNPKILQKIDAGEKDILVMISIPQEVKLLELSQLPDFNKFLSFKQNHDVTNTKDYLYDSNDFSFKADYHISPKDALKK